MPEDRSDSVGPGSTGSCAAPERIALARAEVSDDAVSAAVGVLRSGWLGRGEATERFEVELSCYLDAPFVVAVATGTAAIQLALEGSGIGPGDEVIVPSLTFAATYQAVDAVGASVVFADVDADTLCLDPEDVDSRIGPRTRAIVTMHMCGHAGHRGELERVAAENDLVFVEDAAHAFGSVDPAEPHRRIGSTGNPVCFSFDPIKSLTCGQGGAVATSDPALAEDLRVRSDLGLQRSGRGEPHVVTGPGHRFAMSDLNAAIGLAQLGGFDDSASRRRELHRRYRSSMEGVEGVVLPDHDSDTMVPFAMTVRVPATTREVLRRGLDEAGVETGVHYAPGHLQPLYAGSVSLPVTEGIAQELLTLPLHPSMTAAEVDLVVGELDRLLGTGESPRG